MKILVFSPYYYPHIGGLQNYAKDLNEKLTNEGMSVVVFTSQIPPYSKGVENINNVKIIRFPAFEIIHNYPFPKFWKINFWKVFLNLFRNDFDLTLSHTRFFSTSLMAIFFSKIKKIKWIHIEHGSDFSKIDKPIIKYFPKIYDYTIGKVILRGADRIISVSKASSNFTKQLAGTKVHVIYRGFDIKRFESINPDKEISSKFEKKLIVTFTGRLIEGKGVINLVKAVEKIDSDNLICLVIGDGSQTEKLRSYIRENKLENKVFLLGAKQFEQTISILKASDIFVNPSYTEGLPTSVLEAALCKKGIIATDVGGTNEVITGEKDGFLIKPGSVDAIVEKIEFFIKNPEKIREYGEKAHLAVSSKFGWEKQIKEFIKLFALKDV